VGKPFISVVFINGLPTVGKDFIVNFLAENKKKVAEIHNYSSINMVRELSKDLVHLITEKPKSSLGEKTEIERKVMAHLGNYDFIRTARSNDIIDVLVGLSELPDFGDLPVTLFVHVRETELINRFETDMRLSSKLKHLNISYSSLLVIRTRSSYFGDDDFVKDCIVPSNAVDVNVFNHEYSDILTLKSSTKLNKSAALLYFDTSINLSHNIQIENDRIIETLDNKKCHPQK
jgi:hypothetical protein